MDKKDVRAITIITVSYFLLVFSFIAIPIVSLKIRTVKKETIYDIPLIVIEKSDGGKYTSVELKGIYNGLPFTTNNGTGHRTRYKLEIGDVVFAPILRINYCKNEEGKLYICYAEDVDLQNFELE